MAKLICTSRYTKNSVSNNAGNLVKYMGISEGVEKLGAHGLFSQTDDKIDLNKACNDVAEHDGYIWTHVLSLTREDAERLGYNNAKAWRELVRRNVMKIAEAHKLQISEMKWYAAFHNTEHHPHIHLLVYSENPKHSYMTKKGIESMRSTFANDIFRNEMHHLFTLQTQMRNEMKQKAKQRFDELLKCTTETAPCRSLQRTVALKCCMRNGTISIAKNYPSTMTSTNPIYQSKVSRMKLSVPFWN